MMPVISNDERFERRCDAAHARAIAAIAASGKPCKCRICGSSLTPAYIAHNGFECPECACMDWTVTR